MPRSAASSSVPGLVTAPLDEPDDLPERVAEAASPIDDVRGTAQYRRHALHVLTSRDITDLRQLEGKKVSFDVKGSGTDSSGRAMFAGLGVQVEAVNVDQPSALRLLESGELAAVVSVAAELVPRLLRRDKLLGQRE